MANLNGMGPREEGPMTGRGMGNCGNSNLFRGQKNRIGLRRFFTRRAFLAKSENEEKKEEKIKSDDEIVK